LDKTLVVEPSKRVVFGTLETPERLFVNGLVTVRSAGQRCYVILPFALKKALIPKSIVAVQAI